MNSIKTQAAARLFLLFNNAEPVDTVKLEQDLSRLHKNNSIRSVRVSTNDQGSTTIDIGGQVVEISEPEDLSEALIASLCKVSLYKDEMESLDGSFDNARQINYKTGGAPPILQMMLLTFTAYVLKAQGATAMLNPNGQTAMPLSHVNILEEGIFTKLNWFDIYTGIKKSTINGKLFLTTTGSEFYGFSEFGVYARSDAEEKEALATMENVFDYLGQNEIGIKPDDTMQMDEKTIKFRKANKAELDASSFKDLIVIEDLTEANSLLEIASGLMKERDYEHAIELLNQCLNHDPGFKDALYARATLALTMENGELALKDFTELAQMDPSDHKALVGKANSYSMMGQFDSAQTEAKAAIKLAPKYSGAKIASGLAYIGNHDYENALETLTQAIKLDDQNAQVYYLRSKAYVGLNQMDKAKKDEELASVLGFNG